jgi:hypothetical protein
MQLGLCCSPLQQPFACRLAARLERNLGITTLIVTTASQTIAEAWEQTSACTAAVHQHQRKPAGRRRRGRRIEGSWGFTEDGLARLVRLAEEA